MPTKFKLSKRSELAMAGVHPDLVRVVRRAIEITEIDFAVIQGTRTMEKQLEYVRTGASQTLASRHLTGHAVDLAAYVGSELRWDWPLYDKIAAAMKQAANELSIPIVWGGDWKKFPDGPHFELSRKGYP